MKSLEATSREIAEAWRELGRAIVDNPPVRNWRVTLFGTSGLAYVGAGLWCLATLREPMQVFAAFGCLVFGVLMLAYARMAWHD